MAKGKIYEEALSGGGGGKSGSCKGWGRRKLFSRAVIRKDRKNHIGAKMGRNFQDVGVPQGRGEAGLSAWNQKSDVGRSNEAGRADMRHGVLKNQIACEKMERWKRGEFPLLGAQGG